MRKNLTRKFGFTTLGALFALPVLFLAAWSVIAGPVTVSRIISKGDTTIYDYRRFPGRSLQASSAPFRFETVLQEDAVPTILHLGDLGEVQLDELLDSSDTIAFLIAKDDVLIYCCKLLHRYGLSSQSVGWCPFCSDL